MSKPPDSRWRSILRKVTGIGAGHLYNPWRCSAFMRGKSGTTAWWRVCDMLGVNIGYQVEPSKWPPSHLQEEYTLFVASIFGWRIEILRPHRYRRFPWERRNV